MTALMMTPMSAMVAAPTAMSAAHMVACGCVRPSGSCVGVIVGVWAINDATQSSVTKGIFSQIVVCYRATDTRVPRERKGSRARTTNSLWMCGWASVKALMNRTCARLACY